VQPISLFFFFLAQQLWVRVWPPKCVVVSGVGVKYTDQTGQVACELWFPCR